MVPSLFDMDGFDDAVRDSLSQTHDGTVLIYPWVKFKKKNYNLLNLIFVLRMLLVVSGGLISVDNFRSFSIPLILALWKIGV